MLSDGFPSLLRLADLLKNNAGYHVRVEGNTDNLGSQRYNEKLGQERADAVKAYLNQRGIEAQRMIVSGRGPDLPVADNATSAGRAQNRRIEFIIRRS